MEIKSVQKYIIASPQKIREVVPLIKGLSPAKAYEILPFTGKRTSDKLRKVIGTALANAKEKGAKEENLYFKEIQIGEGPRLKRWRAGARGMAKPYKRRMSHIRVVLGVREGTIKVAETGGKISNKKSNFEGTELAENTEKEGSLRKLIKSGKKKSKAEVAEGGEKKTGKGKKD